MKIDLKEDKDSILYNKDETSDYFILILQGRVQVSIGAENMNFDCGQFMYFGIQALTNELSDDTQPSDAIEKRDSTLNKHSHSPPHHNSALPILVKHASVESILIGYIPDYTVRAISDLEYLKIDKNMYIRAVQATKYETQSKTLNITNNTIQEYNSKQNQQQHHSPGAIGEESSADFCNPSIIQPQKPSARVHFPEIDAGKIVINIDNGTTKQQQQLSVVVDDASKKSVSALPSPQEADAPLLKKLNKDT